MKKLQMKDINDLMCFIMKEADFKEVLNVEFKNPEIIKLAIQLGEFTLNGYRYINSNRANKKK